MEAARVVKGGVRRGLGAPYTRLRALRRWEGLGDWLLRALQKPMGGQRWEGCGACMPGFVPLQKG